jgi:translation initiation factor eIF-2B subunit gamma
MATVKEKMEQDKGLLLRHSLTKKHPRVKMLSTFRDAHLYIFPYWVKELALRQETFQSVSEDLVGFWAKAEWQRGLGEKLGMDEIFHRENGAHAENGSFDGESIEEEIDLLAMSTTSSRPNINVARPPPTSSFASRVSNVSSDAEKPELKIPPLLAYVQRGSAPFVRRVDSSAILLSTALRLAKLESIEEAGAAASPFALPQKIAHPEGIAQRTTITKSDCLVGQNTTVESKCVIKESVIGANVKICSGARLQRCLIMDGAVVNSSCTLTGCIVGRRAVIGKDSVLKDSEVGDGYLVEEETDAKNEKFMIFEGLEDDEEMGSAGEFDGEDELGF